jgi:hypothetical protein
MCFRTIVLCCMRVLICYGVCIYMQRTKTHSSMTSYINNNTYYNTPAYNGESYTYPPQTIRQRNTFTYPHTAIPCNIIINTTQNTYINQQHPPYRIQHMTLQFPHTHTHNLHALQHHTQPHLTHYNPAHNNTQYIPTHRTITSPTYI